MAAPLEVVISSDSGSQLWNCTVFDLHSGSSLLSYRGGNSAARSLAPKPPTERYRTSTPNTGPHVAKTQNPDILRIPTSFPDLNVPPVYGEEFQAGSRTPLVTQTLLGRSLETSSLLALGW
ncbi:hypothetical protein GOODEAATRI_033141 [Goodea atripinnis]|uniref:Uncharacterized protein n=1 Tax=Goodea atripinnis TaxID=208336 RepID=A0ABV0NQ48_9TELE